MIGGIRHILIATAIGLCTLTLSDHWGTPGPEDVPTKFTLQPKWNTRVGTEIQKDCDRILDSWPRSGPIEPFDAPRIVYCGVCAIGLFVQSPQLHGPTAAHDRWEKILWTTMVAIKLNVGTVRSGWSIDFPSGVQVCFFFNILQFESFDMRRSIEWNLNRSPFFQGRTDSDIWPDPIPIVQSEQWLSDLRNHFHREGHLPVFAEITRAFTPIGADYWGTRPVPADCEAAISHLGIESWFIAKTGVELRAPMFASDGHCTLGIYLMEPVDLGVGDTGHYPRVQGVGIDVIVEATKLLRAVELQAAGGGYVNLRNGLQLCLYDRTSIDPSNVCSIMTKMSLRDCLDNRAAVNRVPRAADD
ncbi:hypothetical protein MMC19_005263 [Ptychographa xylographoides]|nr:hypothetical protein [Ptychographa xylographoides]